MQELGKLNPNLEVILASDAEENSYPPLLGVSTGVYIPDSTWGGDFTI